MLEFWSLIEIQYHTEVPMYDTTVTNWMLEERDEEDNTTIYLTLCVPSEIVLFNILYRHKLQKIYQYYLNSRRVVAC